MRGVLWIAVSLALVAFVEGVSGQSQSRNSGSNSLVLRGEVLGVKEEALPAASVVAVTTTLKLKFVNTGSKPVILLTDRSPLCVGTTLTKNAGVPHGDNVLFDEYRGPSVSTSPDWKDLHSRLDEDKPPSGLVQIIEPGKSWSIDSFVVLRPPIKFERYRIDRPPVSWNVLRDSSPVWLRLKCDVWPLNVEADPASGKVNFGRKLQKRWRQFGELQLDNLVSEPIELNLRELADH